MRRPSESGAALLVVLGLVAVLAVVVVAFTERSNRDLSSSRSLSTHVVADEVASTVTEVLIKDLKQEMLAGSVQRSDPVKGDQPGLYPMTPHSMVPDRTTLAGNGGSEAAPPNLLKQSSRSSDFYNTEKKFGNEPVYPNARTFPPRGKSSDISSTAGPSGIPPERWNRPLLLPRANPQSATDRTPAESGSIFLSTDKNALTWKWTPPDWVYLRQDGSMPPDMKGIATNPVVARFAYQIYDVGGLLDLNVAGYDPEVTGDGLAALRGSAGLANLRELGFSNSALQNLVRFRNPATLLEPDALPRRNRYLNFLFSSALNHGFLRAGGSTNPQESTAANRGFSSRGALISFLEGLSTDGAEKGALLDALQSLTHYSRALEQPSFMPGFRDPKSLSQGKFAGVRPTIVPPAGRIDDRLYDNSVIDKGPRDEGRHLGPNNWRVLMNLPYEMALGNNRGGNDAWGTMEERGGPSGDKRGLQDVINPAFLDVRVQQGFVRYDGTYAEPGEPLVKKRFPLDRLAWVTHAGPSAEQPRNSPLYNASGTAQAIYDCFGLSWAADPLTKARFWAYDHGKTGGILKLEELTVLDSKRKLPREPDFFELLKASIGVGSLGKSALPTHIRGYPVDPAAIQQTRDRSTTLQIIEIAANLIDQSDRDSYPTVIRVPNPNPDTTLGNSPYSPALFAVSGVEDLPYFYRLHFRGIQNGKFPPFPKVEAPVEITDKIRDFADSRTGFRCGTTSLLAFPELWNPHAKTDAAYDGPVNFRIVAANETPQFLGDPLLQGAPKQGNLNGAAAMNSPFLQMVRAGDRTFINQPGGFFAYRSEADLFPHETNQWMRIVEEGDRRNRPYFRYGRPMQLWNPWNMTFEWPYMIDHFTIEMDGHKKIERRSSTLFWNSPTATGPAIGKKYLRKLTSTVTGSLTAVGTARVAPLPVEYQALNRARNKNNKDDGYSSNMTLFAPLWKLPEFENGQFPWMKPPVGWPLNVPDAPIDKIGQVECQPAPFLKWSANRVDMGATGWGYYHHFGLTRTPPFFELKLQQYPPGPRPGGWPDVDVLSALMLGLRASPRTAVSLQPLYVRGMQVPPHLMARTPWPQDRWFYGVNRSPAPGVAPQLELWRCLRAKDDLLAASLDLSEFDIFDPSLPGIPRMGPLRYPLTLDPHKTFYLNSFHAGYGNQTYQLDRRPVENPFPMYRMWTFALTAQDTVQRAILQTNPLLKQPSGERDWREGVAGTAPTELGDSHRNIVVDMRGSELRFSVGNTELFREPTTLCRVGLPGGSNFASGPSNFLSGDVYGGSILDMDGQGWSGFSLGEVPSQIVIVSKAAQVPQTAFAMEMGETSVLDYRHDLITYDWKEKPWTWPEGGDAYFGVPPLDLATDAFGRTQDVLARKDAKYGARFFIIPTNVVHLDRMFLTVRLEYQQPGSGAWIPYDERYVSTTEGDYGRQAAIPVDRRAEYELKASDPSNYLKRGELYVQDSQGKLRWDPSGRPIGWGTPFITSYDPRTSRFGSPWRPGYPDRRSIYGDNPRDRQVLNPAPDSAGMGSSLALYPAGGAPTDRPSASFVDTPGGTGQPMTTVANYMVPGAFNDEMIKPNHDPKFPLPTLFNFWARGRPERQWWACARLDGKYLYQYPTANAYDIGWFPRLHGPGVSEPPGVTPNYRQVARSGTVPNFFQRAFAGNTYADALRPGSISENVAPSLPTRDDPMAPYRQAYADPDDVVRRADGAFAVGGGYSSQLEGLPMSQPSGGGSARQANRPVILNRPFHSVAEMGYAFRGAPWKTVSFSTPESADAALLDVFCISEPPPVADPLAEQARSRGANVRPTTESALPLVAGKINLNSRQEPVLRALMVGALKDAAGQQLLDREDATRAARALIGRTTGTEIWNGPLTNVSELVGKLFAKDLPDSALPDEAPVYTSRVPRTVTDPNRNRDMTPGKNWLSWHFTGYSADLDSKVFRDKRDWKVHRRREAVLRALVDAGQTRVWNLMFDIIVQTGQLPPGVDTLARFSKTSECRAWVCVSLDRLTGEVVDHQVEWVSE